MPDHDRRTLEYIAAELGRLQRQAEAVEGGDLLAYLIDMAITEARNALQGRSGSLPPEILRREN
jgi:hypothetical protein